MSFCSTLPSCVSLACAPPRLSQGLMHAYQLRTQEGEGACVCVCVCGLPEQLAPSLLGWTPFNNTTHHILEVKQWNIRLESQNIKTPRTWKHYTGTLHRHVFMVLVALSLQSYHHFQEGHPNNVETFITQACGSCFGHFESPKLPSFSGRAPQQCTIPGPGTQAEHPETQDLETFITQACGSCVGHFESPKPPSFAGRAPQQCPIPGPGTKAAEHPQTQDLETFITQACGSCFGHFESPKLPSFLGRAPQQCPIPGPGSKASDIHKPRTWKHYTGMLFMSWWF